MSPYLIQIVRVEDGAVVQWAPGKAVEADFIENLCARVQAKFQQVEAERIEALCERVRLKGVGMMRTEAHVVADVRASARELVNDAPLVADVRASMKELLRELKFQVRR